MADSLPNKYLLFHDTGKPIVAMEANWPIGTSIDWHTHPRAQLLYAIEGVMVVRAGNDSWVVPPSRALWLPAGIAHKTQMSGAVKMRTVYIDANVIQNLPSRTRVINVSNLLRELIIAAVEIPTDSKESVRESLLMQLLIEELSVSDELPLHLPVPQDKRIRFICESLLANPDSTFTVHEWADKVDVVSKTIQRLFIKETGMTFTQWREQVRLLNALRRIASGEKILDTALDCGYSSPSAFTAMFKRSFGVPPSSFYRNRKM